MFGQITNPFAQLAQGTNLASGDQGQGLIFLISNIVKLLMVLAGIYTFMNFILAGYQFLNAGGDAKKVALATEKIWQSTIGLIIVVMSIILIALISWIVFGNFTTIISPSIYTP